MVTYRYLSPALLLALLVSLTGPRLAVATPEITSRINDLGNGLFPGQEANLEAWIQRGWDGLDVETAVLVVHDTEGMSLEQYTAEVAAAWGLLLAERPEPRPVTAERPTEGDPQRRFLIVAVIDGKQLDLDFGGDLGACFEAGMERTVVHAARDAWQRRGLAEAVKDILSTVAHLMSPTDRECRNRRQSRPVPPPTTPESTADCGSSVVAVFGAILFAIVTLVVFRRLMRPHGHP